MKQISEKTACYSCLGCNKLELEWFNGVYNCKNQLKVIREQKIEHEVKPQNKIKSATGEQLKF